MVLELVEDTGLFGVGTGGIQKSLLCWKWWNTEVSIVLELVEDTSLHGVNVGTSGWQKSLLMVLELVDDKCQWCWD